MLTEVNQTQYAVVVRGQTVGTYYSRNLAEAAIITLPEDQRSFAEVVVVESNTGKTLLLG